MSDAPSPFLQGTKVQYAWDSTSLGYLKTCPRLYQYIMIEGWGSSEESVHLRFGIEYHRALQDYDLSRAAGINHEDSLHDVIRELLIRTADFKPDKSEKPGKYKNRGSLLRLVIDYLDKYNPDPAKTHILQDGKPAVELSFRFELDWTPRSANQPYLLCGHLDRVVEFQDDLFVMDRKTTTTTPSSYYFAQFEPNNQMSLYSLASQVVLGSPVKGVIIDSAQTLIEDNPKFVRGFTFRTGDQLAEWTQDLRYWFSLAESFAIESYWPMNDTACDKFGGCRFREICSKSPGVRSTFLKAKFKQLPEDKRWNPLIPRE